jgi:SAM-dependent methyltransferase
MNVQAQFHGPGFDYEPGSPHLRHDRLRRRIANSLSELVRARIAATGRCHALELGAGHGTFTACLRAAGASVLVTEMSPASAASLLARFADDDGVEVEDDPDGDWVFRSDAAVDLAVCVSVLHHIPDYLRTVRRICDLLAAGGAFACWQDPTWYPTMPLATRALSTGSYFAWRVAQGELARGAATRWRRLRRHYVESNPDDMAEYHVVRNGVDHRALADLLSAHFTDVAVASYWSTQSARLQAVGERLGLTNTFGIEATGAHGEEPG